VYYNTQYTLVQDISSTAYGVGIEKLWIIREGLEPEDLSSSVNGGLGIERADDNTPEGTQGGNAT
jgi:hypothetical protein